MPARTAFDLNERDLAIKTCADVEALTHRLEKIECRLDKEALQPLSTTMIDHRILESRVTAIEKQGTINETQRAEVRRSMNVLYAIVTVAIATMLLLTEWAR